MPTGRARGDPLSPGRRPSPPAHRLDPLPPARLHDLPLPQPHSHTREPAMRQLRHRHQHSALAGRQRMAAAPFGPTCAQARRRAGRRSAAAAPPCVRCTADGAATRLSAQRGARVCRLHGVACGRALCALVHRDGLDERAALGLLRRDVRGELADERPAAAAARGYARQPDTHARGKPKAVPCRSLPTHHHTAHPLPAGPRGTPVGRAGGSAPRASPTACSASPSS